MNITSRQQSGVSAPGTPTGLDRLTHQSPANQQHSSLMSNTSADKRHQSPLAVRR